MPNSATARLYGSLGLPIIRRAQLLRGQLWRLLGATVGYRFGVGPGVRILYPECLTAGDNVTIEGPAYLHCLSERGVRIGRHTSFGPNLWLHCGGTPGDCAHGFFEIGEHSFVGANAVLGAGGGITIGSHVLIGQSVNIHAESHVFDDPARMIGEQGVAYRGVTIEDDVWIGSKATILDGVTVGHGAVVGAGAVVVSSIPPFAVAVGVPARVLRFRGQSRA
jgi:acetyltransferase-like isoleucine patch superfamily enzyme